MPCLRPNQSRTEYFSEFLDACDCAEHGLDENALVMAWDMAKKSPPPAVAMRFKSPKIRALIGLCSQLQQHAGEQEFFLSCRSAARLLEVSHVQAARFLKLLDRKGVTRIVEAGSPQTNRATRYRFSDKPNPKGIIV